MKLLLDKLWRLILKTYILNEISLIVPCYNEQESLPVFFNEINKTMKTMGCTYELLFVDDGSSDNTLEILKAASENDPHIRYISFSRNFGKESAMYAGFCNAHGKYIAVMDADLQDPPALLPEMLRLIKEDGYDSVATRRISRKGEPAIKSFFARQFYKLINRISDANIVDGARDFRLMKKEMVDVIVSMSEYNRFSKGIFGWIGFKTYWLPLKIMNALQEKLSGAFGSCLNMLLRELSIFQMFH